ncbi:hypothetical protein MLD59_14360 [Verrucomicrobiaceae bacterium E54]|nr:hypothetical protein [Verrucomicrobiaceae bacterium E54]
MRFEAGDDKESMVVRGLSFDAILKAPVLDFVPNPKHEDQMILVVEIDRYAVAVPCKPLGEDHWLMVTAYPSRKLTNRYIP